MPVQYRTEEEAKKQWCPYAAVRSTITHHTGNAIGSHNRLESETRPYVPKLPSGGLCIGSVCAKWDEEILTEGASGKGRCGA